MQNSPQREFIGALGIYTAGGLFWAFLPFFIGLQVSSGGLSQAQAGSLGSAYLVGFSIASLSGVWWIGRFNWRKLVVAAAIGVTVALLLLKDAESYLLGVACVSVIGVLMGALWTIAYRIFSASPNPERSFAIGIVVSYTILAAVSYTVGQWIVPNHGLAGSAYLLSGIILFLGLAAFLIARGPMDASGGPTAASSYSPPLSIALSLLGLLATGLAFAAVWAFAERIGNAMGFSASQISPVVASNLLGSAAGSVLATIIGTRFGRKRTLIVGMMFMALSLMCLLRAEQFLPYAAAIVGLGFTVGFVLPYQMGIIAGLDTGGKFVVLIGAAQGIGSALGPLLGGIGFGAGGTPALVAITVTTVVVSTIIFSAITINEK